MEEMYQRGVRDQGRRRGMKGGMGNRGGGGYYGKGAEA
jgi:hypothetical protein